MLRHFYFALCTAIAALIAPALAIVDRGIDAAISYIERCLSYFRPSPLHFAFDAPLALEMEGDPLDPGLIQEMQFERGFKRQSAARNC